MRRITLEAQRMGVLVDDMLRLARLDQHPGQQCETVDLSALAAECVQRARTAQPGQTWDCDITDELEVTGDEELLRRAIDNVLGNVAAHTPEDAAASLTVTGGGGCVVVEVSDDGPGVPPDPLPRIFDRFYRVAVPARRPGRGLGLAIVAAVAAAHQGSVAAALNEPHGLRITLTLPASIVADGHSPLVSPDAEPARGGTYLAGRSPRDSDGDGKAPDRDPGHHVPGVGVEQPDLA
jgi:two-component system, OmpR family, sensor kinase